MPYKLVSKNNLLVGVESYYNGHIFLKGRGVISIGSYCTFGENLRIIAGNNHNYNYAALQVTFYKRFFGRYVGHIPEKGIEIGSDVWSGDNVTILDGSKVGDGCVLASGSVVKGFIPPYSIAGGVPAKVIKKRFSPDVINLLMSIEWWRWDDKKIESNYVLFHSDLSLLNADDVKKILVD